MLAVHHRCRWSTAHSHVGGVDCLVRLDQAPPVGFTASRCVAPAGVRWADGLDVSNSIQASVAGASRAQHEGRRGWTYARVGCVV